MIRVAGPELTCTSGGGGPWNHSDEQQCFGRPVLNSSKYSLFNLCETSLFFSTLLRDDYKKGCIDPEKIPCYFGPGERAARHL